eukprot:g2287.t1
MRTFGLARRKKRTNQVEDTSPKCSGVNTGEAGGDAFGSTRLPPLHEDIPCTNRPLHYASVRPRFDSMSSAAAYNTTEKALAISRAYDKQWTGVDELEDDLMDKNRVLPAASPILGNLPTPQEFHSPRESSRERSPMDTISEDEFVPSSSRVLDRHSWKWNFIVLTVIALSVISLYWSDAICHISPVFESCHQIRHDNFYLPVRDRYFKAIVAHDSTGRFGKNFEKGLVDAAKRLRVNVSVHRTELQTAAKVLDEASCSLFDGLILTLNDDDPPLRALLPIVKDRTPVITAGALESSVIENGVGRIGEQETNVGKQAAVRMRDSGTTTSVCLSRVDNVASVSRCQGFRHEFGERTYEINLNTMLQSELKSKLIPIILDNAEINGLFVADPRSFPLVHQILKTLNRLCSNKKAASLGRCIYFGTYGMENGVLKALKRKEIQFTIDPQEYLHGFLSLSWMMLVSYGYPIPSLDKNSSFQLSRVIDSMEQAKAATTVSNGFVPSLRFQFVLYGEVTSDYIQRLRMGLRNAARDFNVHVELHHCVDGKESIGCNFKTEKTDEYSKLTFDGYAFSSSNSLDSRLIINRFDTIAKSGKPYLTFGKYKSFFSSKMSSSSIHIGYNQMEDLNANESTNKEDPEPALHGYLSVVILAVSSWHGELPCGFLKTRS